MGINELELTQPLIAAIFPDSLVQIDKPDTAVLASRGGDKKNISFLVQDPLHEFISEKNLNFILRILKPCALTIEDVRIVNILKTPVSFTDYTNMLKPRVVFCWGILPGAIGLDNALADFNITVVNGISVVPVHSIEIMQTESPESVELKKRLWTCLKKLFAL